jgi:chromatin assembly factor 1 subunit B
MLIMTSTDGFCSTIIFEPGELGEVHPGPAPTTISTAYSRPSPSTPSNPSFPTPTARAASPARSNSSSSIVTVSAFSSAPKVSSLPPMALSAPSPTSTFVQPVSYSGARQMSISSTGSIPVVTPPETPSGIPLKRDETSEAVETPSSEEEPKSKKRRVAPTLISSTESQK